jgi:hypothetical protein
MGWVAAMSVFSVFPVPLLAIAVLDYAFSKEASRMIVVLWFEPPRALARPLGYVTVVQGTFAEGTDSDRRYLMG